MAPPPQARCAVTCSATSRETVNSPCPASVPVNHGGRRKHRQASSMQLTASTCSTGRSPWTTLLFAVATETAHSCCVA
ncbi:hypothetical protein LMH87_010146 [Akanthomyces muscarius]|uniref:Uncharacterized protein n=1 Tax=Akanthomyces muscarius TaxID=2231603 RepID=A0A9W8QFE2_AKAMU|nr:hypothetical protein LMH87_010146 [Akanthomyces muscarius]KAJ4153666.1 hypothetical protein LMH87_010146 [Akanthomyces muscarius]